jgi:pimeloyl-ACP methyl ester carboxylesterase
VNFQTAVLAGKQWLYLPPWLREDENTQSFLLLSRNSQLVVAEKSGHEIHLDQPELVVNAIRGVVEAVKNGAALKPIDSSSQK